MRGSMNSRIGSSMDSPKWSASACLFRGPPAHCGSGSVPGRRCVVLGGGYVNTELREVADTRLWEAVDALTLDDGEGPLAAILEHLQGAGMRVTARTASGMHGAPAAIQAFNPAPDYELPLDDYLQVLDTLNPAQRLWGDARWNKLTLAHGCYWKRCALQT